jgi:hypothetical protein
VIFFYDAKTKINEEGCTVKTNVPRSLKTEKALHDGRFSLLKKFIAILSRLGKRGF